ncbi:MAG: hypothetical protein M5R42_05470 [Rhodocyclaceae bacterium]|nr:hypothetical protein [Rhodocyclaceae bacterium]
MAWPEFRRSGSWKAGVDGSVALAAGRQRLDRLTETAGEADHRFIFSSTRA